MKTYSDLQGYATIEANIIINLSTYICKKHTDINNIVIVGAYHGYEIDRLGVLYPNSKFWAFEPFYKNFNILQQRYSNNPRVKCLNYACSDFIGEADFHELNAEGNGSLLKVSDKSVYKLKEVETVKVKVVTLDSILKDMPVDLLWVDVQGKELNVLRGYTNKVKAASMFLEVQVKEDYGHDSYEGNCYLEDLQEHLKGSHSLHSLGLDNELKNGTGNSFWIRNSLNV